MASLQQDQDNDQIRITHYINPHNFWFKHESAYLFNPEEQQFQMELNKYCEDTFGRGNITTGIHTPSKVGELVALFYFQLGRWIRAKVDDIQEELGGKMHCVVWSIDEGFPIKTDCRYIKPLPERFAQVPTSVKHGGLEGTLPAECGYDYLLGQSVKKVVPDWCPGVVRIFESCIEEAVSISLCNLFRYQMTGIDMYFGTMKITSHQNVTNNALDLLRKACGMMVMIVGKDEFYDKFPSLLTIDMRRFEDNDRRENLTYHTNSFRPDFSARVTQRASEKTSFRDNHIIEQAREKFLEWDKRNIASSVITASQAFNDYLQVEEPTTPHTNGFSAGRDMHRFSQQQKYSALANESISDDGYEEPPKVEFRKPTPPTSSRSNSTIKTDNSKPRTSAAAAAPRPPYQRTQVNTFDKSIADIAPALHKIKLRRQATLQKQQQEQMAAAAAAAEEQNGLNAAQSGAINLVPAGFCLGNVELSTGSAILGDKQRNNDGSVAGSKYAMMDRFERDPPNQARQKSQYMKQRKPHYRRDEEQSQDSSFEEEMIRKLTITTNNYKSDEEDEQW